VVIDDLHWGKKEDLEALEYLARKLFLFEKKIVNMMISSRPMKKTFELDDRIGKAVIDLKGLDDASVEDFSSQILEGKPLEPEIDTIIRKRAEGNPFYIEQFLLYLKEKELIVESQDRWDRGESFTEDALPESVFTLILSRIDHLEERVKESLRVASVTGMEFKEQIIEAVMNMPVRKLLKASMDEQLTYLKDMRELEYIFSHTMIRDVIYESILRERRKQIHLSVGKIIERGHRDSLAEVAELLAYHFRYAEEWEKEKGFVIQAAEKAYASYRSEEAMHYFSRAIALLKERFPEEKETLAGMYEKLGLVYNWSGKLSDAFTSIENMSKADPGNSITQVSSMRIRAAVLQHMGKLDEGLDFVNQAEAFLDDVEGGVELGIEHALVLVEKCRILQVKGEIELAEESALKAIAMLKEFSTRKEEIRKKAQSSLALSITILCGVYYHSGKFKEGIERYKEAIELYKELNEKIGIAMANSHLGLFYHALGELETSTEHYQLGISIWERIGDIRNEAIADGNLGLVFYDQCAYGKAIEYFTKHLRVSKESEDRWGISIANGNLGMVYATLGDFNRAISFYEEHRKLSKQLGYRRGEAMACGNFAKVYREQGKYQDAIQELEKHIAISREVEDQLGEGLACSDLGAVYLQIGEFEHAEGNLSKARKLLEEIGNKGNLIDLYNNLSELNMKFKGSCEAAEEFASNALELSEELENRSGIAQSLVSLARIEAKEQKGKAEERYRKAIEIYEELGQRKRLADVWQEHGEFLKEKGKKEFKSYLNKAKRAYKEMGIEV
jgi:tetratricopeptide (TPR) repeat protein